MDRVELHIKHDVDSLKYVAEGLKLNPIEIEQLKKSLFNEQLVENLSKQSRWMQPSEYSLKAKKI